eukprot:4820010-Pleurochrysis_carterae.AAC.1
MPPFPFPHVHREELEHYSTPEDQHSQMKHLLVGRSGHTQHVHNAAVLLCAAVEQCSAWPFLRTAC